MSLTDEERLILVNLELDKADKIFAQASLCIKNEMWDMLANRLYYAVFHATSALLIKNGLAVGTHKGTSVMLNKEFVKTGIITTDEGHLFSRLQQLREEGDYNCYIQTTKDEILPVVEKSEMFISKIKKLVL